MKSRKGLIKVIQPPWASISTAAPSCALAPCSMGGFRVPACPRGTAGMSWKAGMCLQQLQPTARFVLQAFAGRTAPLRCVQGCSHPTCQSRIHLQPWEHCSSPGKIGRHFSVLHPKCLHTGFAEHGGLSRELASPWNNPPPSGIGGWWWILYPKLQVVG